MVRVSSDNSQQQARDHLWMHFTRHSAYDTNDVPTIVRGDGAYIYDAHGKRYLDGYEIRTAAVLANIPCITTVQGLGAAVQGIEALRAGDVGVCSLQDWARRYFETAAAQPPQQP
jgi:hypothetical protein